MSDLDPRRERRASMYVAKLFAERVANLSDASLTAAFAQCVRPPRPAEYPEIRAAYIAEYGEPSEPSLFEVSA